LGLNDARLVLSAYAPTIVSVLIVLIVAATAWAVMRNGGAMRRKRSYSWVNLPGELPNILSDFQQSIDGTQEEARRAAKMGEAIVGAMGAVELALKDFKNRITELEKHAGETEKHFAELKLSLAGVQKSLEENARAAEKSNARHDGFGQRMTAVTDKLTSLTQATESATSEHRETHKASREELRAISNSVAAVQAAAHEELRTISASMEAVQATAQDDLRTIRNNMAAAQATAQDDLRAIRNNLAATQAATQQELRTLGDNLMTVQARLTALSRRADVGETGHAQLSAVADTLTTAVAALKSGAKEISHRMGTLEPRVLWRIEELETLIKSSLAAMQPVSKGEVDAG
jgi:chromosome segregation ATPase